MASLLSLPPLPLVRAVDRLRGLLGTTYRALVPGHVALLEMLGAGFLTQAIHAAAELGVADALADGPRDGAELARTVGADEDALRRLMRLLTSEGIFAEDKGGKYTLTPMAQPLRSDCEVSLRDTALFFGSTVHREHWSHLVDAVRTGEPVGEALDGMPFFDLVRKDRSLGEIFDRGMTSIGSLSLEPLLAAYDFGAFETIVDIGGGEGTMIAEILGKAPQSKGVLVDLPEVAQSARTRLAELGLANRCAVESGSFFESVPEGGDAYLLKHVLHDWSDDDAGRILGTVHRAMCPHARLLIIELVVPEDDQPHPSKFIDLEMLVNTGGRERTEAEYREFLAEHGFTLTRVVPTVSPNNILEARLS
ncbi:methyltransferase [Nocardia callitridis]|uniref:Methyltransferase n=1 Tax=Nocardia callitridis TaxID=648753 RepID=A0ABP9L3U9_9NOCA